MLRRLLSVILLSALVLTARAQRLSVLAETPDWTRLEAFQETITREEFTRLLDQVYAPGGAAMGLIAVEEDAAAIKTTLEPEAVFRLRFAKDAASAKPVPRYWRPAAALGPAKKPFAGVKIALDPGHLGGEWARIEERFYQIGATKPVAEGEMTLRVAELLAPQLRALGAEVSFVRKSPGPTIEARPESFHEAARTELKRLGIAEPRENYDATQLADPTRGQTVQWQSEILFYRVAEIRHRAKVVNEQLKPDLVLCIHFNAEGWGDDPAAPVFVPRNHLHLLVNGCYSASELRNDDVRFDMLRRLLDGSFAEEVAASGRVADALADATKLPPYAYTTGNALRVGDRPYIWARNLLANRLYDAPVIFLEPYVMNSQPVWERVQAGDYEGEKMVAGELRKSIYREYADAVAAGLRTYFQEARGRGR